MAVVIKTKNNATGTPASLEVGELAVNTTDGKLFVGSAVGGVIDIDTSGLLPLDNTWTGFNQFRATPTSLDGWTKLYNDGSVEFYNSNNTGSVDINRYPATSTSGGVLKVRSYATAQTNLNLRTATNQTAPALIVKGRTDIVCTISADGLINTTGGLESTGAGANSFRAGTSAGATTQGNSSIALGQLAGETNQGDNGVIISGKGVAVDDSTDGHIHIASNSASLDYTGAAGWSISNGSVDVAFPSTAGTIALTSDIPTVTNLLPLNNTWTALNTFTTGVKSEKLQIDTGQHVGVISFGFFDGLGTMIKGYSVDHPTYEDILEFYTGDSVRMRVSNPGVSIGPLVGGPTLYYPDEALVVGGDVKINNGGTGTGIVHFGKLSDKTKIVGRDNSHATLANTIDFSTDSLVRVRIDGSGILNAYKGFTSEGSQVNSFRAGTRAGANSQKTESIAIGADAGSNTQGARAIAIGPGAGNQQQGAGSIALGSLAGGGSASQHANSIVISSAGAVIQSSVAGSITIQSSTSFLYTFARNGGNNYDWIHSGTMTTFSDERLKKDIEPITNALAKVQSLNGVTFKYIDKNTVNRDTGLIAQNVQAVLPEAIKEVNNEGHLGLAYGNMVGLLVEAIKELTAKVEALEA